MNAYSEYSEIFFLLKQADLNITQIFETHMAVSLTRYELLLQLQKNDFVSQRILQEKLKIDQAAITRHLKILETKGYVIRERNPENNREVLVHLSDEGKSILQRCDHNKSELVKALFSTYSSEQLQQFATFLKDFNDRSATVLTTMEERRKQDHDNKL